MAILKMTSSSQSPRDRILWILANRGWKLERSRLRQRMATKYVDLDPIQKDLSKKEKTKIFYKIITLI